MENKSYVQLYFRVFAGMFPDVVRSIPVPYLNKFLEDNFLVRIYPDEHRVSIADCEASFYKSVTHEFSISVSDVKPSKRPEAYHKNKSMKHRGDKK